MKDGFIGPAGFEVVETVFWEAAGIEYAVLRADLRPAELDWARLDSLSPSSKTQPARKGLAS